MQGKKHDLVGRQFGRLTVIARVPTGRAARWLCRCQCGVECSPFGYWLLRANDPSCGCRRREVEAVRTFGPYQSLGTKAATKHGMRSHLLYVHWVSMKTRCYNPKTIHFEYWGGKGVRVCEEWKDDFVAFFNWSMLNGWEEGYELDRKEASGDYSPDNCQWLSAAEHGRKTRRERRGTKDV